MSLLNAVSALYRTLEAPASWDSALSCVADALNADHVVLDLRTRPIFPGTPLIATRIPTDYLQQLAVHPEYDSMYTTVLRAAVKPAVHGSTVIDRRMQTRSSLFNDVIRPMGGHHAIFGVIPAEGSPTAQPALLSACRPATRSGFPKAQLHQLDNLLPHLASVLRLHRRLAESTVPSAASGEWWHEPVLDRIPLGIILIDKNGRHRYANRRAERLIAENPGLRLSQQEGLIATDGSLQRALRLAIQAALAANDARHGAVLRLPGSTLHRDCWLRIVSLGQENALANTWHGARVAVFFDGPDETKLDPVELSQLFDFTARETALARLLLAGYNLQSAAVALNLSQESVRSRLKTLFLKTGTHRQAELVQLLTRLSQYTGI
jgi:DNA-binding CsgD family transcriptional regulator